MKSALGVADAAIGIIVTVLFGAALALAALGVAGRYISARLSLDWISEVVVFMIIWAILLGVARVSRRGAHIRVDFLYDRLSERGRWAADLLSLSLALALSLFLVWSGWLVVKEAVLWNERSISTLRVPLWIYYAALSTSFALQTVFLLERAVDTLAGRRAETPAILTD